MVRTERYDKSGEMPHDEKDCSSFKLFYPKFIRSNIYVSFLINYLIIWNRIKLDKKDKGSWGREGVSRCKINCVTGF